MFFLNFLEFASKKWFPRSYSDQSSTESILEIQKGSAVSCHLGSKIVTGDQRWFGEQNDGASSVTLVKVYVIAFF